MPLPKRSAPNPTAEDIEGDDASDVTVAVGDTDDGGMNIDLETLAPDKKRGKEGGEERDASDADGALEIAAEDENEEVRKRRREERAQRKADRDRREREKDARLEAAENELRQIRQERGQQHEAAVRGRVNELQAQMEQATRQFNDARELKERAFKDRDNPESARTLLQADDVIMASREAYLQADAERRQIIARAQENQRRPVVPENLQRNAKGFMKEHPWYDINGKDRDSAAVLAIDRKMSNTEGWDPNTDGYWEELRERVREELPHKFEEGRGQRDNDQRAQDDPPVRRASPKHIGGSDRDLSGDGGARKTFYLSPSRIAAIKEAGFWEDPAKRASMIRRYREHDQQQAKQRR